LEIKFLGKKFLVKKFLGITNFGKGKSEGEIIEISHRAVIPMEFQ
jgi:hypothetical protein